MPFGIAFQNAHAGAIFLESCVCAYVSNFRKGLPEGIAPLQLEGLPYIGNSKDLVSAEGMRIGSNEN